MKAKTVIGKANELVAEHGKEYAIRYFQDKIDEMGMPKDMVEIQTLWVGHCNKTYK